jgi:hypothetical protein
MIISIGGLAESDFVRAAGITGVCGLGDLR